MWAVHNKKVWRNLRASHNYNYSALGSNLTLFCAMFRFLIHKTNEYHIEGIHHHHQNCTHSYTKTCAVILGYTCGIDWKQTGPPDKLNLAFLTYRAVIFHLIQLTLFFDTQYRCSPFCEWTLYKVTVAFLSSFVQPWWELAHPVATTVTL